MKKSIIAASAGITALIGVCTFALLGAVDMLTELAVNRTPKRSLAGSKSAVSGQKKKQSPSAEKIKYVLDMAREELKSKVSETVQITSHDGLKLVGHVYPADAPKRVLICMHGWRSSWDHDFAVISAFLHDGLNSTLVFPEQRGQGESEGDFISFGILERHDCLEWIKYAKERYGEDVPVYLMGISMGATTVLMATGADLPKCVKGVIADCGFTSPGAIMSHVVKNNLKINEKLTYPLVNKRINKVANLNIEEHSATKALECCQVPVLFIHGSSDTFVPVQMTFENYEACIAPKDLLIVPGAGHGMSYVKDTEAYEKAVRYFFKKYDKSTREEIEREIERRRQEQADDVAAALEEVACAQIIE